jgi:RecB family exonuclease
MTATVHHLPIFRNEHLSVSRLKKFEQCALAFYFQYVNKPDKALGEGGKPEPAEFGTVLHDALERTYQWIVNEEYEGSFPETEMLEFFRLAWSESGLVGVALYQEGRELLRGYAKDTGYADHMRTLAVENEFNLLLGPGTCRLVPASEKESWAMVDDYYVVNGFIDRCDRVDAETVEIIDYKSNRMLFTREELTGDLQMSLYSLAAREMFPWAKRIRLSFHMLRHGIKQVVDRTADDLAAAREYVLALGARTERGPYEPKLNTYCGTCDHRTRCDAYKGAMERKLEVVAVSKDDLEAVSIERERVAKIAKAAYARKDQLDDVLRAAIGESDNIELAGTVYRLQQNFDTEYPVDGIEELLKPLGVDLAPILRIDNKALDAVLEKMETDEGLPRTVRDFLRVRVAAKAVKLPQKPRLYGSKKKT